MYNGYFHAKNNNVKFVCERSISMSRNYYTNRSRRTTTILTLGILVAAFAIGMTVFLVKKNNKTTNKGEDNTWQNSSQIDQATQRDDL